MNNFSTLFKSFFGLCLVVIYLTNLSPSSLAQAQDQIKRNEFIRLFAQSQPDNPFLPKNHANLSDNQLYAETVQTLSRRGVNDLNQKEPGKVMTHLEFVRLSYALTGEPAGKSLFEQKLFLKLKGILSSADIGLTTGLEGQAQQFHKGDPSAYSVELASPVFMSDKIKTDNGSNISFAFDDNSTLTLGEDAVVHISKHIYNPDKGLRQTIVNVASGMVRFVITEARGKGSMFKVVTPTATAGVLGTEFVTVVKPDGQTQFIGIKNQIETAPLLPDGHEGKSEIVSAGQIRSIDKNGLASPVALAPPELIQTLKTRTTTPQKVSPSHAVSKVRSNSVINGKWITKAALGNIRKAATQAQGLEPGSKISSNKSSGNSKSKSKGSIKKAEKGLPNVNAQSKSKNIGKGSGRFAAKNSEKSSSKFMPKDTANSSARSSAKATAQSTAKDAAKSTARNTAKSIAKDAAQSVAKSVARDTAKSATKDIIKTTMKTEIKTAAQNAAKSSAKQVAKNTARSIARETVREVIASLAKEEALSTALREVKKEAENVAKEKITAIYSSRNNSVKNGGDDSNGSNKGNSGGNDKGNSGGNGKENGKGKNK